MPYAMEYSIDIPRQLGTWPWHLILGTFAGAGPTWNRPPHLVKPSCFWAQNGVCGILWAQGTIKEFSEWYQIPYTTDQNMRESWYSMICSLLLYHHYISLYDYSLVVCSWYLKTIWQKPNTKGRSLCRTLFDGHLGVYHIFNSDEGS